MQTSPEAVRIPDHSILTPYSKGGLPVVVDHNSIMSLLTSDNAGIIPSRSAYREDAEVIL